MASQTRNSASEDERRQKVRTLTVASIASASAAIVVSQFWIAGTWMAAALTPVLVTIISEVLHKPTTVIAGRFTTERDAVLPEAGGAGRPPLERDEVLPRRARSEPGSEDPQPAEAPVNVYRSGAGRPRMSAPKRKVAIGAAVAMGALAFAISAIAITGTELITGGSIGKGSNRTTFVGGSKDDAQKEQQDSTTPTDQQDTEQQDTEQQPTTPQETTPTEQQQTPPEQTVPAQPAPQQKTTPVPEAPTTTTP